MAHRGFSVSVMKLALVAPILGLLLSTTLSNAQGSANNSLTQGVPPFSLQTQAGGGIDSINMGNLDVHLTVPLNALGAYGPKAATALVMDSMFFTPWIQSWPGTPQGSWSQHYSQP